MVFYGFIYGFWVLFWYFLFKGLLNKGLHRCFFWLKQIQGDELLMEGGGVFFFVFVWWGRGEERHVQF